MPERPIMFVCTANVCRSPMAEYLLRHRLGPESKWEICSAGFTTGRGLPATQPATLALREHGIDLRPHRSMPITRELVDAAFLIVVMTVSHREQMRTFFPDAIKKVFLLNHFNSASIDKNKDVEDPIGAPPETYRRIRDEIEAALPNLISFIKSTDGKG